MTCVHCGTEHHERVGVNDLTLCRDAIKAKLRTALTHQASIALALNWANIPPPETLHRDVLAHLVNERRLIEENAKMKPVFDASVAWDVSGCASAEEIVLHRATRAARGEAMAYDETDTTNKSAKDIRELNKYIEQNALMVVKHKADT